MVDIYLNYSQEEGPMWFSAYLWDVKSKFALDWSMHGMQQQWIIQQQINVVDNYYTSG